MPERLTYSKPEIAIGLQDGWLDASKKWEGLSVLCLRSGGSELPLKGSGQRVKSCPHPSIGPTNV